MSRQCGECSLCCKTNRIDELESPAGQWCKHCTPGDGCGLHIDRPQVCRNFECLWLGGMFDEDMRPDRIGVLFMATTDNGGVPFVAMHEQHHGAAMASSRVCDAVDQIEGMGLEAILVSGGQAMTLTVNGVAT